MKLTLLASLCVATVVLTGCGASSHIRSEPVAPVSMAALGPVVEASASDMYFFGAGDDLGRQIFTVYVASLNSDEYYATGADDSPSE
jgi:hypothetical protein